MSGHERENGEGSFSGRTRERFRLSPVVNQVRISTERLTLRSWRDADREPFARMNADSRVMEFLRGPLAKEESDAMLKGIEAHFKRHGFGLWAAELRQGRVFIGFVGLEIPQFEAHYTPCVEIGWRLSAEHWGEGWRQKERMQSSGMRSSRWA